MLGVVEVNAIAQGMLQRFTQWPWIEHPTFQMRSGPSITELSPPTFYCNKNLKWCTKALSLRSHEQYIR